METATPPGLKLADMSSMDSVTFADLGHFSQLRLSEKGGSAYSEQDVVALIKKRVRDDQLRLKATLDKPLVEREPGLWAARLRYAGTYPRPGVETIEVLVVHVIPRTGLYLECQAQLTAPASESVDVYERFCLDLRWRKEVTGQDIAAATNGTYPFEDRDLEIVPPAEWRFVSYRRWPDPEVTFRVDAIADTPHPSGVRMELRIASLPIHAASVGEEVARIGKLSLRSDRSRWFQEPREIAAGVWTYRIGKVARPDIESYPEALEIAVASAGDTSRVMWCFVTILRPEDRALADELERFCREHVAPRRP